MSERKIDWDAVIPEFEKSGLSQSEFARNNGFHPGTLSYNIAQRKKKAAGLSPKKNGNGHSAFVQVGAPQMLEVVYRNVLIRIPASTDALSLKRLIGALLDE